ncbi:MerR family transcriptional regulator [Amphritea japonica]|uniref:MerR family transcriptional regulator n=1 Tax=Amphritea japonica ATCC BAA-1530 TaxID=1278309 RepID=A0A7R6P4X7_9GAMM|nr:MerR family transcriptional regulator [Amphritea japonica]BBB25989.1 MerR family transcriptional regulator [Amphritea japonica ATCC BAA-1530]
MLSLDLSTGDALTLSLNCYGGVDVLTISALAKKANLSRTAVLYYEREGLLKPAVRDGNGYRLYGQKELERLALIVDYRAMGVPVSDIAILLEGSGEGEQKRILQGQLHRLQQEVERLHQQQVAILQFIQQPDIAEDRMVTKERWTEIMSAAGLSENDMHNWHIQFEKLEPGAHQEFLESLQIEVDEVQRIRVWSRC